MTVRISFAQQIYPEPLLDTTPILLSSDKPESCHLVLPASLRPSVSPTSTGSPKVGTENLRVADGLGRESGRALWEMGQRDHDMTTPFWELDRGKVVF